MLSVAVFVACPFVCLFLLDTPATYRPSMNALNAMHWFDRLYSASTVVFGLSDDAAGVYAFMRLMAFAYTYHYLNWFSKTRIINWHQISRRRLLGIIAIYIGAVILYWINFDAGFIALTVLSMGHVVLEFPLNYRSVVGILSELHVIARPKGRSSTRH
jgi:hypothetical protein